MKKLRDATKEALMQFLSVLESVEHLPGDRGHALYADTDLGKHVRHVVDHFLALQSGLESGMLDYNVRHRDSEMERDLTLGKEALLELASWLDAGGLNDNKVVKVRTEMSCKEIVNVVLSSNLERELHYVAYHTIHHAAFCAQLVRWHGVTVDPLVGIAPSTATYLRATASA